MTSERLSQNWLDDGFVAVRGAFSEDMMELLRVGTEKAMSEPSETSKEYAEEGKGRFFTDHHMHRRIPEFKKFLDDSTVKDLGGHLMRSKKLNLFDEHLLVKEPGTENPSYWHQDLPYYEIAGTQIISMWIPMDPTSPESGSISFVRGSHRWGKVFQPIRIGLGDLVEEAETFDGPAPDIEAEPEKYDIVTFDDLEPGDCLAFQAAVLHYASPNVSTGTRRRAVSIRFAGDDVTWQPRPYIPSVTDSPDLVAGGPLDSDQYPVVWTEA
ncbi:MAG: phytanoyl-CoA dioxygenase [Rhodospirillaceae bacterium]|nr:phytanoyl-CoA dioxygenase [Rhodospirillaceae bacterium]|tara:strand:- start:5413 stop:6216 length:804 start_codon:yes stop_codon:yes gene_type:complete